MKFPFFTSWIPMAFYGFSCLFLVKVFWNPSRGQRPTSRPAVAQPCGLKGQEINPKMEGCSPWYYSLASSYPSCPKTLSYGFWSATRITTRYGRYIRSYMVDLPTLTAGGSHGMNAKGDLWLTLLAFDFKGSHTPWGCNVIKVSLSFFGWNVWCCKLFPEIWRTEGTPSSHLRITLMSPRRESNLMQILLKKSFCSRQSFSQSSSFLMGVSISIIAINIFLFVYHSLFMMLTFLVNHRPHEQNHHHVRSLMLNISCE